MTLPPDIPVKPLQRSIWERISVVWLIPVIALVIALSVAWQAYYERGPVIQIAFDSASGLKAGETVLRYRDVNVGLVETVRFSDTLENVEVEVRLTKEIAPFVDDAAQFWVVRPEVTAQGVTGIDTVLSGVFIEGIWDTVPAGIVTSHIGLEDTPLLQLGQSGTSISLRVIGAAALRENSPIVYKGITVGRTGKPRLSRNGIEAVSEAIIYAPHDALINSATRFWDTSGFSFSIGANGAELDFSSLASLISGGLTFETIVSGGQAISDGHLFDLFPDENTARASVFSGSDGPALNLAVIFDENVSGLAAGSPVEYGGVRIGKVLDLSGLVDEARFGDQRVRLLTTLEVAPDKLGLEEGTTPEQALAFLAERVGDGLRARLATASLLTGGLKIELLRVPDAPFAVLDQPSDGLPVLPTAASNVKDVAATAQGVLKRVNDLPIEELMSSAILFLDTSSALVGSEDIQNIPAQVSGLLGEARGVIGAPEVQELPQKLTTLLTSVQDTTEDLRKILAQVEQADAVARLLATVDALGVVTADVGTALEGVPALIAQVEALAAKANALPVEVLVKQTSDLMTSANLLIASDKTQALPEVLTAAMADLQAVITDVTAQDGVARLLAAIDAAGKAADEVSTSVTGVPELIDQLSQLAQTAKELPVDQLVTQLTEVVKTADTLLGAEETKDLPVALSGALREVSAVLAELRAGGTVENANQTLASAASAADAFAAASTDLPRLVARLNGLIDQATSTLSGFDGTSDLNRDTRSALRQVQKAAEAVTSLARALERRPNSIILGR